MFLLGVDSFGSSFQAVLDVFTASESCCSYSSLMLVAKNPGQNHFGPSKLNWAFDQLPSRFLHEPKAASENNACFRHLRRATQIRTERRRQTGPKRSGANSRTEASEQTTTTETILQLGPKRYGTLLHGVELYQAWFFPPALGLLCSRRAGTRTRSLPRNRPSTVDRVVIKDVVNSVHFFGLQVCRQKDWQTDQAEFPP